MTGKTHFDFAQCSNSDKKRVERRRNPENKLNLIRPTYLSWFLASGY